MYLTTLENSFSFAKQSVLSNAVKVLLTNSIKHGSSLQQSFYFLHFLLTMLKINIVHINNIFYSGNKKKLNVRPVLDCISVFNLLLNKYAKRLALTSTTVSGKKVLVPNLAFNKEQLKVQFLLSEYKIAVQGKNFKQFATSMCDHFIALFSSYKIRSTSTEVFYNSVKQNKKLASRIYKMKLSKKTRTLNAFEKNKFFTI